MVVSRLKTASPHRAALSILSYRGRHRKSILLQLALCLPINMRLDQDQGERHTMIEPVVGSGGMINESTSLTLFHSLPVMHVNADNWTAISQSTPPDTRMTPELHTSYEARKFAPMLPIPYTLILLAVAESRSCVIDKYLPPPPGIGYLSSPLSFDVLLSFFRLRASCFSYLVRPKIPPSFSSLPHDAIKIHVNRRCH